MAINLGLGALLFLTAVGTGATIYEERQKAQAEKRALNAQREEELRELQRQNDRARLIYYASGIDPGFGTSLENEEYNLNSFFSLYGRRRAALSSMQSARRDEIGARALTNIAATLLSKR